MDLNGYLSLFTRVLSDWRVVFIAVATILAWAALRYVGMVYDRRPSRGAAARSSFRLAAPAPKAPRARAQKEEEEDEGTIG
jgi:hypothetical protein